MKRGRTFDPNMHTAYLLGQKARLEKKPLTACPNLTRQFDERYAIRLMDAWIRGWQDRDREQKAGQLSFAEVQ